MGFEEGQVFFIFIEKEGQVDLKEEKGGEVEVDLNLRAASVRVNSGQPQCYY